MNEFLLFVFRMFITLLALFCVPDNIDILCLSRFIWKTCYLSQLHWKLEMFPIVIGKQKVCWFWGTLNSYSLYLTAISDEVSKKKETLKSTTT